MPLRGFHFILNAYGFWLPNDPRGSWSDYVRAYQLRAFGPVTKVDTHRSVAHVPHDQSLRRAAKDALRCPPVRFTGVQATYIAAGFAAACEEHGYVIHALAILPDHTHVVMAKHPLDVDRIAAHLKAKATRELTAHQQHPLAALAVKGRTPSPWARKHWCPYLFTDADMRQTIEYVQRNPLRAGLRGQRWSVVTPYGG